MTGFDDLLALDAGIAAQLPTTWPPFLGGFGRLRPVQRIAIPPILAGQDVLVISPTASGKTEAACAPLIERNFSRRRWTILYISPTRALVNDLFERLAPPVEQLALSIRRRTGDHHDPMPDIPNLVLTTPESFDSLLCRGRSADHGHILGFVRAVVLDEIHLLHGSARGEQVRWLLERLRRLREQMVSGGKTRSAGFQTVALSATVPDPDRIATSYLGTESIVVSTRGARPIEIVASAGTLPDVETAVPEYLRGADRDEKLLVFSNNRKRVDHLTRELTKSTEWLNYQVRAHHGSLAQTEREATERTMKQEGRIVVCSTMTLEIGIDIGDVDLVVLDSPAPSVSSLLQRVGRGNRRTEVTRVMPCSGSEVEVLIHSAMLDAARRGDLGQPERGPQFAVAHQQLASYIFQAPERSRPRPQLEQFVRRLVQDVDPAALLDHLIQAELLHEDASGVRLGAEWQDRTTRGQIHSNIEDAGGYEVADDRTGAPIGKGIRSQRGRGLGVAGKLLEVKGWDEFRILVRRATSEEQAQGEWSYVNQAWMRGAGQPRALQAYLGIEPNDWPALQLDGQLCVFHFGGSRRRAVLQLVKDLAGRVEVLHLDDWSIWLAAETGRSSAPTWLTGWAPSQLEILLGPDRLAAMERILARPQANRKLPVSLRVREVSEWLDLAGEHAAFAAANWRPPASADERQALTLVASELRRPRKRS